MHGAGCVAQPHRFTVSAFAYAARGVSPLLPRFPAGAPPNDPSAVFVLQGTDFGKRSVAPDGQPFWVTIVDEGFTSDAEVEMWCARTFSQLTPAELANACAARTLAPPHD